MRDLVIALHCSGSSSRQWRGLEQQLLTRRPGWRFVALDLHGHGSQAPWPDERPLTLADEAALVAPLLVRHHAAQDEPRFGTAHDEARRSTARVHLVGHSYGGAVALKVASQFPGLVHSVAVFEPVLPSLLRDDPANAAALAEATALGRGVARHHHQGDDARAAKHFVDYWSGPRTWTRLPEPRRAAAVAHVGAICSQFDALHHERTLLQALPRLRPPVLVLTGSETVGAMQRTAARLRSLMPRSVHETLRGLGHMGPVTDATWVNERLVAYLSGAGLAAHDPDPALPPGAQPARSSSADAAARGPRRFSPPFHTSQPQPQEALS